LYTAISIATAVSTGIDIRSCIQLGLPLRYQWSYVSIIASSILTPIATN
jgi:hypothetical protein